jgi:hypothetical protein
MKFRPRKALALSVSRGKGMMGNIALLKKTHEKGVTFDLARSASPAKSPSRASMVGSNRSNKGKRSLLEKLGMRVP